MKEALYIILMELPGGRKLSWYPNERWEDVSKPMIEWTKGEVVRELPRIMSHVAEYSNRTKIYVTRPFDLWIKIEINRD